jgi:arabinan endo-1,5-alpha-L-arabinosidase
MNAYSAPIAPAQRRRVASLILAAAAAGAFVAGCGGGGSGTATPDTTTTTPAGPLATNQLTGAIDYIHDPAVLRQGATWHVFSTDRSATQGGFIPERCSTDKIAMTDCGYVFGALPSWVAAAVPLATEVWAPDVSYFDGVYHLYYSVSSFGSNVSAIGMATNTTLDHADPAYAWVDQGVILQSASSDDFNAIDPNVVVDASSRVWLSYGSFWTGIYQIELDPGTGQVLAGATRAHLAQRLSTVQYDPIEGADVVLHNGYYYLFTSWDFCCESTATASNYKIVVGRGTSPNGPFVDKTGVDLAAGGGTLLLAGTSTYGAPGGATVTIDATGGDTIVFHALDLTRNGVPVLFMKSLTWSSDWPVIGD